MTQAARIKRGTGSARPRGRAVVVRPQGAARQAGAHAGGLVRKLPISAEFARRLGRWGAWALAAALLVALAVAFKLPQMAGTAAGEAIGSAGFTVKHVDVGPTLTPAQQLAVRSVAADQESGAMPLIDLDQIRDQLLQIGWVADARVSRRLPDRLVIDVIQRVPAAIWQNRGRLSLIDADGTVLGPVALDAMPDLPVVIGPAANLQAAALSRLLATAPAMREMMAGATWIGGRRWDLRFQSGEVLALPEGEEAAAKALAKFARLDTSQGLLGKGFVRIDMRLYPKPMYVRVSREPGKRVGLGDARLSGGAI